MEVDFSSSEVGDEGSSGEKRHGDVEGRKGLFLSTLMELRWTYYTDNRVELIELE